jgi:hypothetical protein
MVRDLVAALGQHGPLLGRPASWARVPSPSRPCACRTLRAGAELAQALRCRAVLATSPGRGCALRASSARCAWSRPPEHWFRSPGFALRNRWRDDCRRRGIASACISPAAAATR